MGSWATGMQGQPRSYVGSFFWQIFHYVCLQDGKLDYNVANTNDDIWDSYKTSLVK